MICSPCNSTNQSTHDTITTSSPPHKVKRELDGLAEGLIGNAPASLGDQEGLPNRDLINPPYTINNAAGSLSNKVSVQFAQYASKKTKQKRKLPIDDYSTRFLLHCCFTGSVLPV